jgi:hypothetical protein
MTYLPWLSCDYSSANNARGKAPQKSSATSKFGALWVMAPEEM